MVRSIFSANDTSSGQIAPSRSRTAQDTGATLSRRFCFTSISRARKRRPPTGTWNMPVSTPSASITGKTLRLWIRPRRVIEAARPSIETPAFTRRTLDWLRNSLLKGMSRENDRVIFSTAVTIGMYPATGGQEPLSRPPTRLENPVAPLPLSRGDASSGALRLGVGLNRLGFRLAFVGLHLKTQSD